MDNGHNGHDEVQTCTRELPCELSDNELQQKGAELAAVDLHIAVLKAEKKAEAKRLGDAIKELEEQQETLATCVDNGTEQRLVSCRWDLDFEGNEKRLVRIDTGDTVETVTMDAEDLQTSLLPAGGRYEDGDQPSA